jgi:hypothetical protein
MSDLDAKVVHDVTVGSVDDLDRDDVGVGIRDG